MEGGALTGMPGVQGMPVFDYRLHIQVKYTQFIAQIKGVSNYDNKYFMNSG